MSGRNRHLARWSLVTAVVTITAVGTALAVAAPSRTAHGVSASGAVTADRSGGWNPEPARYGMAENANVPVTMPDGTVLRANVFYPTDQATGRAAAGKFPVIMVQTPYGKDLTGQGEQASAGNPAAGVVPFAAQQPYLVERGYIDVVVDVRGEGTSGGTFGLLDPVQGRDGARLVRWASRLPHADGKVGLYGPSYMGVDQFLTSTHLGKGSPLKAMFPIVTGDPYRDVFSEGGLIDFAFDPAILALFEGGAALNPVAGEPSDPLAAAGTSLRHMQSLAGYALPQLAQALGGGPNAYDGSYWQQRTPMSSSVLRHVVATGVPAYVVGGWYDLFQRSEPLLYSGLQNAWDGRPPGAPMEPGQPVTGRYQLLMGPWYHVTAGNGANLLQIELAWFDRWLKGIGTGIDQTSDPAHLQPLGTSGWVSTADWPATGTAGTTYYLDGTRADSGAWSSNDGSLRRTPPAAKRGADTETWLPVSSFCNNQAEQYTAGALALVLALGQLPPDPCAGDDRSIETGPGALTYTTAPYAHPVRIAGPIDATIYATSTRPDTELVATLEDVGPGGTAAALTSGALDGSLRAVDSASSWYAADGKPLLPYHPYTLVSQRSVIPGEVTRFDIEIKGVSAVLAPGHRLRLTLATSSTPHLIPTLPQTANLAGGVYRIQRNAAHASFLEVPLAPAGSFSRTGSAPPYGSGS